MAKILLVEDEVDLSSCLKNVLEKEAHLVELIDDGQIAAQHLRTYDFDLIILDWMLPGFSGIEICRKYRNNGGEAAVLMLTARSSVDERAEGLDSGADDYLSKPFHMKEFLARVRALLRRSNPARSDLIRFEQLLLDLKSSEISANGRNAKLLNKELDILAFLLKHRGQSFSSEELLNRLWSSDKIVSTETVRTHVKNLRRKLEAIEQGDLIVHVRGLGYGVSESKCSRVSDGV
ncbi:MAG: response regulator transcription factor [Candidatus Obscuribacterales bacterium]|nr:response regulator transcription factor [Candidatus Obscuribacterales bacterium]